MLKYLLTITIFFTLYACVSTPPHPTPDISEYEKQITDWHQKRNDRLNQPDGWLTLSGLFWLEEGVNTFGGSRDNDLIFPGEYVAPLLGTLVLEDDSVSIRVADGIEILIGDSAIHTSGLKKDSNGDPDFLTWGSLTWYVIERGDRIGIRLKDSAHPNYVNFKPTQLFPIDSTWRVPAHLEVFDSLRSVDITNVLGDSEPNPTPGRLHFKLNGAGYTLTPLGDPGDKNYFIIFGDASNGLSTYGAGRFLVIPAADENGNTVIDFNKSYNMPCVFSPYATCPLPPQENLLSIAVEAGEMNYSIEGGH